MSDRLKLQAEFEAGRLLRPSADVPNVVDLARALAKLAGAEGVPETDVSRQLAGLVGPAEHLVLVVADGFGASFVEGMAEGAFSRDHLATELLTVFPSATDSALTSLATGEWPAQHAGLGWYLYLEEIGAVSTILPFIRRSDAVSLTKLGVTPEQAFPVRPLMQLIGRDCLSLLPVEISGSVYTRHHAGGHPTLGFKTLAEAVDLVLERTTSRLPTFTYLYWNRIDAAAHELGTRLPTVAALVDELDGELQRLAAHLPDQATVAVTADHGLLDADDGENHWIVPGDDLDNLLRREPSGDTREAYFAVADGAAEEFARKFHQRFGNRFVLLTTAEAEQLGLFGPDPLSDVSRERLGDFVAVSLGRDVIRYRWSDRPEAIKRYRSHHSGLSPVEMRVPLLVF